MSERSYTDSQREAINWGEGPVIVLAGPGSGKTMVLTERIIRILKESEEDSFRILALTFTNKAAAEMSERIEKGLGRAEKRLFMGTFHSFCSAVLRNHGTYVGVRSDFDIYSSNDDLNEVVEELKKEYQLLYPEKDIENIKFLNAIQYLERNLCLTEDDVNRVMPKTENGDVFKWFYFKYMDKMHKLNVIDFDMLILLTYQLFMTKPQIARIYRSVYRYIHIDEFQDTNLGQYMLIKSMCGKKNNNFFLVADDDQVIYGWNGASYKRISQFKTEYQADLIQLYQNFRCPPEVIGLANKLIMHNSGRTADKKPLESMKVMEEGGRHVFRGKFSDVNEEIMAVTNLLVELKRKYPGESICVLARTNRLLNMAYEKARERAIDCARSKRKDGFETPYILWIYTVLKLANHRNDERALEQIVGIMNSEMNRNISQDEVLLLADLEDGDLLKALCKLIDGSFEDKEFEKSFLLNLVEGKNFVGFIEDAFGWCEREIEKLGDESHREQMQQEYWIEKKVWKDFQRHLSYNYDLEEITLSTYMQEFSMVSKESKPEENAVQYLTIHGAKGKEFDHVILMGLVNDELPSFQSVKKGFDSVEMEEERRNCFVAITRAKKRLYLTYAEKYFGWKKEVSRFMVEMFGEGV